MSEKEKKKKAAASRQRNFATILYPESATPGWLDRLKAEKVEAFVSPLHDKDVNPDGSLKKPHHHLLLMFDGLKNFETQVKPLFDEIGAVGREKVASTRGYARYLCHLDNPEKARYSESDVIEIGGADYRTVISRAADDTKVLLSIIKFIDDNHVHYFNDFIFLCEKDHPDWVDVALNRKGYIVIQACKSVAAKDKDKFQQGVHIQKKGVKVDPETGEVIDKVKGD